MSHTKRIIEQLEMAEDTDIPEEMKERNRERVKELKEQIKEGGGGA